MYSLEAPLASLPTTIVLSIPLACTMVICHCIRCTEIGGQQGVPVNSSTARSHKQLYGLPTDAIASSASAAAPPQAPRKRRRPISEPTPSQLLDDILSQPRGSAVLQHHDNVDDEVLPLSEVWDSDVFYDDSEDHSDLDEAEGQTGLEETEESTVLDDASSLASHIFDIESSPTSSVALTVSQRGVDSWVWKTHIFVTFLLAYTALSNDEASLILSFIFAILGPLIERHTIRSHSDSPDTRRKLITPAAISRSLNMDDFFKKYLICVVCHKINDWDGRTPATGMLNCNHCPAYTIYGRKPRMVYARRTIEMIVASMLQDDRLEHALEEWRQQHRDEEDMASKRYGPVWSGRAWRQDCSRVNCQTPCREDHMPFVDDCVLSLKLSLNVDWFHPFKGGFSGHYSTGVLLLRIDNMPERFSTLDRRCRGIHLVSLFPGPSDATFPCFADALRLVIDEIKLLDEQGITISTALHPEGRTIRARLNMVVADSPARAKTVGFSGNRHTGFVCPYCPKHMDQFGMREDWEDQPLESWPVQSSTQIRAMASNTIFADLRYFDRQLNSPPDPMHAVYLGICRRFWHKLLIECCDSFRRRLKDAQRVMVCAILPSSIKRPDKRIGAPGGGMPTAEEWVTLFRCLLPFVMLDLWGNSLMHEAREALFFEPTNLTAKKELKRGPKPVQDIYELGLLLCCIVDMLEGDFSEDDVGLLHSYIQSYNAKSKDLLGRGWLVFNNHITEHIPDAIRRFGAPRNFSCLPFERYNGILGRIKTAGHKQGQLELTMMRKTVNRLDLRHLLAQSNDPFFRETLLGYIKSRSEHEEPVSATHLAKREMESDTYRLLLTHLNEHGKFFSGRFVVPHDAAATSNDVILRKDATFLRTVVQDTYPSEIRVAGQAGEHRTNRGNTFVMVALPDQTTVPVRILWLFEKQLQINGPGTMAVSEKYMHIRRLKVLAKQEAFGCPVPHGELLDRMNITFARLDEVGEELVLPLRAMVAQVVVVPFSTHNALQPRVYGLKRL